MGASPVATPVSALTRQPEDAARLLRVKEFARLHQLVGSPTVVEK
jgi:hypothetical protein